MKLYNTLSRTVEEFNPYGDFVKIYVCGITPYDTTHLGHAFTYTSVDILIRYLEFKGFKVRYVQNVTDIDDDILRKANEEGEDWRSLGNRWTAHFIEDMRMLNVKPPDQFPRATEMIPQIIEMVEKLIKTGLAYQAGGNVYFQIDRWDEFGKLCKLSYEDMLPIANERGNNPNDKFKNDPLDFVLWQAKSPGEPSWESPWGAGRPGWHIECSAMSTHFLGNVLDIHAGGYDLCFPHHEAEISQVEPISAQKPFVKFWTHIAMVYHDGEKMSKSLGNLIMVRELSKKFTPDAIRLYLGSHHYRDSWSYDEDDLIAYQRLADDAQQALKLSGGDGEELRIDARMEAFIEAMDNDLDTEKAVQIFASLVAEVLEGINARANVLQAQGTIRKMGAIFGLILDEVKPEKWVLDGWNEHLKRFEKAGITAHSS
ncbi:MAG: cysteine--tRNA ligase [Anaerolineales bacterium]|nr:cysteine--tRNA ligase [Anaerolineales bacterium]